MTKPTKPRASVTMPICPHCQQSKGLLKQAGAYHQFQHDGELIKLFHVKCKACNQPSTLREIWPISPESGAEGLPCPVT